MKENTSWLMLFSRDEVRVWDRMFAYNEYWEKVFNIKVDNFIYGVKIRYVSYIWFGTYDMWFYEEIEEKDINKRKWYIDRRPRYKRILDSLLWIIK